MNDATTLGQLEDALEILGYPNLAVRGRAGNWFASTSDGTWAHGRTVAEAIAHAIEWERARIAARAREEAGAW